MTSTDKFLITFRVVLGLMVVPVAVSAQTLGQLVEGAKKEAQLILSWGIRKSCGAHAAKER
jgi:hypothetical protein